MAKSKKCKNKRVPLRYKKSLKSKQSGSESDKYKSVKHSNTDNEETLSTCDVRSIAKSFKSTGTWNSLTKKTKRAIKHEHFQEKINSLYKNSNEHKSTGCVLSRQRDEKNNFVVKDPKLPTETVGIEYLLKSKGTPSFNKLERSNKKRKGPTMKSRQVTINQDLCAFKEILKNDSYRNNTVEMITNNILSCIKKETLNK